MLGNVLVWCFVTEDMIFIVDSIIIKIVLDYKHGMRDIQNYQLIYNFWKSVSNRPEKKFGLANKVQIFRSMNARGS